ncbi:unnamed protein product [Parascedosporium putredinis]|uniref:Uncharacterized protein n=1 Tax=Parascedosporium putredinis TaxID=1442378 RepID=A0A9P1HBE9_9PEZI|nr:unnamed protein product [Parascedosporium putredinis]CAI8004881.1 unnamed protein product [Parascedosporium putredinis]
MATQEKVPIEKADVAPEGTPGDISSDAGEIAETVNEKALLRKIDGHLLPAVGLLYLCPSSTGLMCAAGNEYLTGLTLYFVGYVIFEIPCNIILKKTTPRVWLPTLTIAWGIVATLMGIVTNLPGFLIARFFLGVTESGLFPGVVYYFSMWYKRKERQFRISLFFSGAALAGAFGGLLAYGIGHMRGIVWENGWRWIFILEGILTVVVAVAAYWFIQNYPDTATFITDKERLFIRDRLASDSDATLDESFTWDNVIAALKDPKCWLYGLGFHTTSLPLYTFSLFLPSIIANLGYKAAIAQLLTVPPTPSHSSRPSPPPSCPKESAAAPLHHGILPLRHHRLRDFAEQQGSRGQAGRVLRGYVFAAGGIFPAVALVLSWPAINISGQTKRAVGNAMQISIGNLGAVLGTQLYRANDGPRYIVGHSFALAYLFGNIVVAGLLWWVLKRENERRAEITAEVKAVGELDDWTGDADPRWRFEY